MNSTTLKNLYTELISISEYIQLKSKIKTLEIHQNLPWIVFSDSENNIMIFDIIDKKPIRAFNIQNFFQEQVTIKDIKFFNINDKQYILNYDLNEIKKIRGIPFHLRSNLLIITLEKCICFYSYITQTFIKTIVPHEMEQKLPIKCEVFNYMYVVIQTSDGSLILWNILDWNLVKVINKTALGKPVSNFLVISTKNEEKYIAAANTNGNLFLIDMSKKDLIFVKLENDKTEHDSTVIYMDFNPYTNILATISKNSIYLVDIKAIKFNKKIPNFSYFKSEKPYGILTNLNNNLPKTTYFIYGKTPCLVSIDLNIEIIKDRKVESKDCKYYISHVFDLESQSLPKISDRSFKIYIAKYLNHTNDYIILGTNKGVVITKFNMLYKSEITPLNKIIDLNNNQLVFYAIKNGLQLAEYSYNAVVVENNISSNMNVVGISNSNNNILPNTNIVLTQVFDNKAMATNFFNRFKISFSYDSTYMSTVDIVNNIYTIYSLTINEELKYNCKPIKYGKCSGEFEWCPFDNIFAITTSLINQVSSKSNNAKEDKNKLSNHFKMSFSLALFKITNGGTITTLYVIDEIPCHRLFNGHYIGILSQSNNQEDFTFPGTFSKFNYLSSNQLVLNFYSWTDKIKMDLYLSEEPVMILSSSDLQYMICVFIDKFIIYSINFDAGSKSYALEPVGLHYYKIIDAYIYENFIFIFLTDRGIYFLILTEDNAYPYKLLKASDEMNMFHLKICKKIKEKNTIFTKKLLPNKILGIYNNIIILTSSFNEVSFRPIDNILLKIVSQIIRRRFNEISQNLMIIEKKYIKSVLAIFKYYFNNDEEILRKIFSGNSQNNSSNFVEIFQIYKYEDYFLPDLLTSFEDKGKIDKHLRNLLVKNIFSNNTRGIEWLHQFVNQCGLSFEILCSKYIDPNALLKSMLTHHRYFESYAFNENYRLNSEMGDKILSRAYERINQVKNLK